MSDTTNKTTVNSFTFPAMLTLLFIGLKLTGHIAWSWFWVLSPLWITVLIGAVMLILAGGLMAFAYRMERKSRKGN